MSKILNDEGEVLETTDGIRQVASNYFVKLFTSELTHSWQGLYLQVAPLVTQEMNVSMIKKSMHPNKAPGPDGFPALFYQRYWDVVGPAVTKTCLEVLNTGADIARWNRTSVVLISKCTNPETMKDFRPISLCNVIYKLISKMLAKRLKNILPDVISETQSAFIAGRHITDNIMVSFECFHSLVNRRKSKKGGMALKLDISKAYDRVEWQYLDFIMETLGFCAQWRHLIMQCVSSVKLSVLVNGQPSEEFSPSRGIPLSVLIVC